MQKAKGSWAKIGGICSVFALVSLSMASIVTPVNAQQRGTSTHVYVPQKTPPPELVQTTTPNGLNLCHMDAPTSTSPLTYLQAATHSESICVAEFEGYDRSEDIDWKHPPHARYRITEILKGPSYGPELPVIYQFHELVNPTMPKHWKFTEKLMPERDSKWILFIESAVPKLGMFDLYQGSYGRQPATEENLNQLNSLLDRYNMRNMRAFNAQQPDTVTLVVHANKAAKAYNDQQWAEAKNEFRICIGERPQSVEFYEGLFNTCMKSGEWDQVAYALEKIFAIDPSQKIAHSYEYGQALFNLNRYDEAIPNLKTALKTANNPTFEYTPKKKRQTEIQPSTGTICIFDVVRETGPLLSYLHASTHSESICLAEYKGYDESNDIGWNLPPKAHYHITEVLKGPPYPMLLPVKFEFHDLIDPTMPKGWKFSEKLMPEKDSKWILFIEFAVPRRATSGQWFELYQGSYGRQPATEENLKQLNSLLDKYNMRNTRP